MELFSPEFFSALLAIVVIDLVLAGDNAIVIAMAARNLPAHLQKKAIVWGAVGAIAVRSAMTLAVMGLDNVLAVAGASHGSYVLVVLGLLISIPVVICGSTQILKLVERFPSITYLGAGVLAWTATKMMIAEPIVQDLLGNPVLEYAIQALVIIGVLGAGFIRSRLALEELIALAAVDTVVSEMLPERQSYNLGDKSMNKILIPVDDSSNTLLALKHAVNTYGKNPATEFHICNVQPGMYRHISKFINKNTIYEWQAERAKLAAKTAADFLERAGVNFSFNYVCGDKWEALRDEASRLGCSRIVIGSAKKNTLMRLFENSTTAKLLETSNIPVEVVTGRSVSAMERWGIPAIGAGAATALMAAIID